MNSKDDFTEIDVTLAEDVAVFFNDFLGFILYAFPWGDGSLKDRELEPWQRETALLISNAVKERGFDGVNAVMPILLAISSGHGIGKSAFTAWLILWIASTRPDSKGTVTAGTKEQLKSKTWAELGKWHKLCITGYWFNYTQGTFTHKQNSEKWRCDAQASLKQNSEAFAGQHARGSTSYYIFDEASAIPPEIWEVAEGGLIGGESMLFAFGNMTRNTGRFVDCFGEFREKWIRRRIDSREVSFSNQKLIAGWIKTYGEDHDFVRVRVKGEAPRASSLQFIDNETVENAAGRELRANSYKYAPVILGVDVAWEGDDCHAIVMRQGMASWVLGKWQHLPHETATLVQLVCQFEDKYKVDSVFVDMHGIGGGVIDALRQLKRSPTPVNSQAKVSNPDLYGDKRTEMWWQMRQWLYDGGSLDGSDKDLATLKKELISPEYLPMHNGKVCLEPKSIMKKRGLDSPDIADALAYTFYLPVSKRPTQIAGYWVDSQILANTKAMHKAVTEYNVLDY